MAASEYLRKYLSLSDGILGIFFTDKDGVVMIKETVSDTVDQAVFPYLQNSFFTAIQQASKMQMGAAKFIVTRYVEITVCQFNFARKTSQPMFGIIVGNNVADIGMMSSLEPVLQHVVDFFSPLASSKVD